MHQFLKFTPAFKQDNPGPSRKLSSKLYDIYQVRVYSE
jgi:hypothetical protein